MSERARVPNIYGIETEYSAMLTLPGDRVFEIVGKCHSVNERLGLYTEPKITGITQVDALTITGAFEEMCLFKTPTGMLSNGGRFYIDPSGPEYDSAEVTSAEEAVHRTFDGDYIVLHMLSDLRESGALQDFQLNRRIVDHNRSSRGIHLNTTTALPADVYQQPKQVLEALYTLNVVKGSMFGSGGLLIDEKGRTAFHHSPRLSITDATDASYVNYRERPLVRLPFKPDGPFSRAETVTSDALNFGWPLRASLVVTNSLIRTLELKMDVSFPRLREPVRAARIVGQYGYKNQIGIVNSDESHSGEKPQTILSRMCEIMLDVDDKEGFLDGEARQVLPEVIDVADKLTNDPESVSNQVESIARQIAMSKKMEKRQVALDSETMCRFDYAWDWIGGGIAETLRSRNLVGWQGFKTKHSPLTAAKRRLVPPTDTRASVRGRAIADLQGDINIEWTGYEDRYLHPLETE